MGIGGAMAVFHKSYLCIVQPCMWLLIATHAFALWQYIAALRPGYCTHITGAGEYVDSRFIVFFIVFYKESGQSHKLQHKRTSTQTVRACGREIPTTGTD